MLSPRGLSWLGGHLVHRLLPGQLILCLLTSATLAQDGGRLEAVREEVRGDNQHTDKDDRRSRHQGECEDADDFLGELWAVFLAAPWLVPHACLHDNFKNDSFFWPHPYADCRRGPMWIDPYFEYRPSPRLIQAEADRLKAWMVRVTLDDSSDFEGLNRAHGQLLFDTGCRLGLQTEWFYLREVRPCGCVDSLWLGDVDLVFRFAECEWMQMRSGLGVRMLLDHGDNHFGFNFTYAADVFPVDPLVATFQFDAGTLGSATLLHGRATLGVTRSGWELFAGYDWLRIGSVDLSGPLVGLRLWF